MCRHFYDITLNLIDKCAICHIIVDIVQTEPLPDTPITIAERVFVNLRDAIVEGRIEAGSKISEPELARVHDISRGSLRDAIGRLEAAGLVERKPNIGARVVSLSVGELLELYAIRESLEGLAARLATENMTDGELDELGELLDCHRQQIASAEGKAYFQDEGNTDFHLRLVRGSGNRQLIRMLGNELYYRLRMYRYQFGMQSKRATRAFQEHEQMLDVMKRRDAEQAEQLMRHHIRSSRYNIEAMITDAK